MYRYTMNSNFKFFDIEPGINRHRVVVEFRILEESISKDKFKEFLMLISKNLGMKPHPELPEPIIVSASGHTLIKHNGLEGMLFWLESGLHAYYWEIPQLITLDVHSCVCIDKDIVEKTVRDFFDVVEYLYVDLLPKNERVDSKKVEIKSTHLGKGLFAKEDIKKDEFIAGFYDEIYEVKSVIELPDEARNYAIQFAEHKFRNPSANGMAINSNHSCEPNCGIRGLFDLVAMRNIKSGEELTWDYAMTEDLDWKVPGGKCLCGSNRCRGKILPYRDLPKEIREEYKDYTSEWLKRKYNSVESL